MRVWLAAIVLVTASGCAPGRLLRFEVRENGVPILDGVATGSASTPEQDRWQTVRDLVLTPPASRWPAPLSPRGQPRWVLSGDIELLMTDSENQLLDSVSLKSLELRRGTNPREWVLTESQIADLIRRTLE